MPIYEYRCPNGHTFEVFQKMTDPPVEACSVCNAGPVQKVLFPVAVHFKGSGFYSTDYGKGRKKAARDGGDSTGSDKPKGDKADKSTADKGSAEKKPSGDS